MPTTWSGSRFVFDDRFVSTRELGLCAGSMRSESVGQLVVDRRRHEVGGAAVLVRGRDLDLHGAIETAPRESSSSIVDHVHARAPGSRGRPTSSRRPRAASTSTRCRCGAHSSARTSSSWTRSSKSAGTSSSLMTTALADPRASTRTTEPLTRSQLPLPSNLRSIRTKVPGSGVVVARSTRRLSPPTATSRTRQWRAGAPCTIAVPFASTRPLWRRSGCSCLASRSANRSQSADSVANQGDRKGTFRARCRCWLRHDRVPDSVRLFPTTER